jgi:hypothetical protein
LILDAYKVGLVLAGLLIVIGASSSQVIVARLWPQPRFALPVGLIAAAVLISILGHKKYAPFLYFQF